MLHVSTAIDKWIISKLQPYLKPCTTSKSQRPFPGNESSKKWGKKKNFSLLFPPIHYPILKTINGLVYIEFLDPLLPLHLKKRKTKQILAKLNDEWWPSKLCAYVYKGQAALFVRTKRKRKTSESLRAYRKRGWTYKITFNPKEEEEEGRIVLMVVWLRGRINLNWPLLSRLILT